MNFGFIFFVPAYVSITGSTSPFNYSIVAIAGPAVNLLLWLIALLLLKSESVRKNHKLVPWLVVTKKINLFLFIFNMLPIPGFDGAKVYQGLIQTFL